MYNVDNGLIVVSLKQKQTKMGSNSAHREISAAGGRATIARSDR